MRCLQLWQMILLIVLLLPLITIHFIEALVLRPEHGIQCQGSPNSADLSKIDTKPQELIVSKRTIKIVDVLDAGWTGHFIGSAAIYPFPIGVQILGKFYNDVCRLSSSTWRWTPWTNYYLLSYGTITLSFWSFDPLVRISWDFVNDLARRMLIETLRGFVGLFDASFVHMATGAMVHVKLTITGKG
ncbi:MAG: hypothetical protein Q9222_006299 [Ikaeria aurantiellina]